MEGNFNAESLAHRRHHVVFDVIITSHLELAQEALRDGDERLLGPGQEPINCRGGDQPGEPSRAFRELRVQRTHAEHQVQVVPRHVREVSLQIVLRLLHARPIFDEARPELGLC